MSAGGPKTTSLHWRRALNTAVIGDAGAVNNDDCMRAYIDLAQSVSSTVADLSNELAGTADAQHKLLASLGDVLKSVVEHLDVLGCLMSHALFKAAGDGALGGAAQDVAKTLAAHNVTTVDALVTLIKQGQGLGNLSAQKVSGMLGYIVGSIGETVVTKVSEKIALAVVPGGDLLAAINVAEKAGDITGLVLGLVDLVGTETTYSNGSVYNLASAGAVTAAAASYPRDVGPKEGLQVPYTPTYWGNADWVTDTDASDRPRTGFWVASQGRLDVFHADGTSDYTIRVSAVPGRLVLVRKTPDYATPSWTESVPQSGFGDVEIIADDKTGNLLTYQNHGGALGGSSASALKIFNAKTGALITDVDAQYTAAGYSTRINPGWAEPGDGMLLVTNLNGPGGAGIWSTSFTGGAGNGISGPSGAPVAEWTDAHVTYTAFDDRSVWKQQGAGVARSGALSATPAVNINGISDPFCAGTTTYVSDDGFVVRDTNAANVWKARVDPSQGTSAGNRALVSSVIPNTCDAVAADDHGVITRYAGSGHQPHRVWTSHYGYAVQQGQPTTDAPYPISDLQLTSNTVFAVSNYDPHLAAFNPSDGTQRYIYPLRSQTIALPLLHSGYLLAIGRDGQLTLLQP